MIKTTNLNALNSVLAAMREDQDKTLAMTGETLEPKGFEVLAEDARSSFF